MWLANDVIIGHWPEEQILQAAQEALQRGLVTRKGLSEYAEKRGGQVIRSVIVGTSKFS